MVKMLPIPSLKKVKITKTKIPTKKSPQDSQSHKKISSLSRRHDAQFQKRSWSSSYCYLCCVTFPLKTQNGDRRSLGFVLVLPVSKKGQEEKRALQCQKVPGKRAPAEKLQDRIILSDFSFNWFCYLLNRECLGETRSVSKEISPKEKEAREHCSLDHISKKTVSCVSHFPECKTLLWAHAREEKELIQKSKGRRKNMPDAKKEKRAAKPVEKSCILKRKEIIFTKTKKNYKLKDQNQK